MALDITHGDLSACDCGAGKPDVTELSVESRFGSGFIVSCCACNLYSFGRSEAEAVTNWNMPGMYNLRWRNDAFHRLALMARAGA